MTYRILDRLTGTSAAALLGMALLAAPLGAAAQQSMPASPPSASPAPQAPPEAAPAPSESASPGMSSPASRKASSHHGTPIKRVEAQIKRLHSELKITSAQSSQWDTVAEAMRDQAAEMEELEQKRQANRASMTAIDDLKSYQAIAEAHAKEMDKLVPAFEALYDKMSPEQQKTADAVFTHHPRSSKRKSG